MIAGSTEFNSSSIVRATAKFGGGVAHGGGSLQLSGSSVRQCSASNSGGAYYAFADVTATSQAAAGITASKLCDNKASSGGALHISHGSVNISESTIRGNVATGALPFTGNGGGLLLDVGGSVRVVKSAVDWNTATGADGGGILVSTTARLLLLENSGMTSNCARLGGAVFAAASAVTITGTTFTNNTARRGGALHLTACPAAMEANTLRANVATRAGGGIFWQSVKPQTCRPRSGTFSENQAVYGTDEATPAARLSPARGSVPAVLSAQGSSLDLDIVVLDEFGAIVNTIDGVEESMLLVMATKRGVRIEGRAVEAVMEGKAAFRRLRFVPAPNDAGIASRSALSNTELTISARPAVSGMFTSQLVRSLHGLAPTCVARRCWWMCSCPAMC